MRKRYRCDCGRCINDRTISTLKRQLAADEQLMARQYNLEWLAQEGFEYRAYWQQSEPPNLLAYRHPDGRGATLEDTKEGYLEVDGKPPTSNRNALDIFGCILRRPSYHL